MKNNKYFRKKINNWLLIIKNGLGNISKFKIPLIIFLLITIVFSITISSFYEINTQINTEFQKSELNNFKPNKIYSLERDFLINNKHRNIFCNDYTEIKTKDNKIKRFPSYSFSKNGCFLPIDKKNVKITYKFNLNKTKILKVESVYIDSKHFKINQKSNFYKNSIHQKLIKRYKETIDQKYQNLANLLEIYFLKNSNIGIKKYLEESIKKQINLFLKHNEVYTENIERENILSKIEWENLVLNDQNNLENIKQIEKLINDNTIRKNEFENNKEKILEDWNKFKQFLNEIKEKKLDKIFQEDNTKEIKKLIILSIGENITNLIRKAKTSTDNNINLGFDNINELKLEDFYSNGKLNENILKRRINESEKEYLTRLLAIKKWVKLKEGKILNSLENELLLIIEKEKNSYLLIKNRTIELLDKKIEKIFEKNKNEFKLFLELFINILNTFENQENNRKNNILNKIILNEENKFKKLKNYILSNYSNFKENILTFFEKNELINFWIKIKNIENLKKELNEENNTKILKNNLFDLNEIKAKPVEFQKKINDEDLNDYILWLNNRIYIENSIFWEIQNQNKTIIDTYIQSLKNFNNTTNIENFENLKPLNYDEVLKKSFTSDSKIKIQEIFNKIKELEYQLNFWKLKLINNFQKLINWRETLWFLFININDNINNLEEEFQKELEKIKINPSSNSWHITLDYTNTEENENYKNFNQIISLWKQHNHFKNIDEISKATNFLKHTVRFVNIIYKKLFLDNDNLNQNFKININFWNSLSEQSKINEINKFLNKYSLNYLINFKDESNIFNIINLLDLTTIQKFLIKKINENQDENQDEKQDLKYDLNEIKDEFQKQFNNFFQTNSYNEKLKIIQEKNVEYNNWILKINEIWSKFFPNDNKNIEIKNKIEKIKNNKNSQIDEINKLKEKIKNYILPNLKKNGFDIGFKKISLKFIKQSFFIEKIINNFINKPINQTKNLFDKNLIFNEQNIEKINLKISNLFLNIKKRKDNFGLENPTLFKNIFLNNLIIWKKINISFLFKNKINYFNDEIKKWLNQNENQSINNKLKSFIIKLNQNENEKKTTEIWTKYIKINYELKEQSNNLTNNEIKKIANKLIEIENKEIENNITNLKIWIYDNNILYNKISGLNKEKIKNFWINKKYTSLLHEAVAKINNIKFKRIFLTSVFDIQKKAVFLIIQNSEKDSSFKLHIVKGNKPMQRNEIVISPTFAKENNLKIGDNFQIFEQTFKIVGFGSQTPFILPSGNNRNPADVKESAIIYINTNFQNSLWWDSKNIKKPIISKKYLHIFLEGNSQNIKNFEKDLLINKNSFTDLTLKLENKINKNIIIDNNSKNLELKNFNNIIDNFRYSLLNQATNSIKNVLNFTSIGVTLLIFFVWIFSVFNLIKRKIRESKLELGFLKAQGIKNYEIVFSYFGLFPPVFFATIFGVFLGFFVQKPVFGIIKEYLSLNFIEWNVNFLSFFIPTIIILILLFIFIFIINWWEFNRKKIYFLITTIDQVVSSFIEIKIKNFFIKIIPKNKIMIKINFVFFLTIWKKTMILLFVVFFFIINLIATIYLLRLPTTTIDKQYKHIKHNFKLKLRTPTVNNPFTYNNAYSVGGIDEMLKETKNKDNLYPIEKLIPKIYWKEENEEDFKFYWKPSLKTNEAWKNFETFYTPLYKHAFNIKWLKKTFDSFTETNKKQFCNLIIKMALSDVKFEDDKSCIEKLESLSIPIKSQFSKEIDYILKEHLPVTSQNIKYNKKIDVLSTNIDGKIDNEKTQPFEIIGITDKNNIFIHDWKNEFSKKTLNNEINVVANRKFLDTYNLKVGDYFYALQKQKLLYLKGKKNPYKKEDWKYLPIGYSFNNYEKSKEESIWNWNRNAKFYKGSLLNELSSFKVNKETGQVQKKQSDGSYKNITLYNEYFDEKEQKSKFIKMIDIERVILYQNDNEYIRIFLGNEIKYGSNMLKRPRNWWEYNNRNNWLYVKTEWKKINKKYRIQNVINTYETPQIFMEQEKLNEIAGFGTTKKNSDYIGDSKYFNTLYSKSDNLIEGVLFGVSLNDENGYFDLDTVVAGIAQKFNIDIDSQLLKKQATYNFLKYFLNLALLSIILNILSSLFLLWFILKGIFEEYKKLTIDLKIIGYSNKEMLIKIISIMFIPIIIGFILGSFITIYIFKTIIMIAKENNLYLFIDNDIWIFVVSFLILMLFFIIIVWKFYLGYKKTNFNEYLRM